MVYGFSCTVRICVAMFSSFNTSLSARHLYSLTNLYNMQTYQRKLNTCYPTGHEIERRPQKSASDTKVGSGWVNVTLCAMTFAWQWLVSPFTCNYCMYAHWNIHENSTVCIQRHWRRNLFHTLHCIKMFWCFRVVISKVDWSFRLIKQCRPILNAK